MTSDFWVGKKICDDPTASTIYGRAVVSGGAGGALAPPEFGSSLNPIPARGADYAHHITGSTPGFGNLTTALQKPKKPAKPTFESFFLSPTLGKIVKP